jgi:hypothetical protein
MWMLSLIPDSLLLYIINAILLIGIVGTVFAFFILKRISQWVPSLTPHYLLIQVASVVLLVVGVYLKGGYSVEMDWREKVREAEEKARIAEQRAEELNIRLDEEIKKKQRVVTENTVVYRERIKEVEKIIDAKCEVAPEAIDIHNSAAKNKLLGESK